MTVPYKTNDFMLDIETLGTNSQAVIIQIGCCGFLRNGTITEKFCMNVSRESGEALGFKTDQSTLNWWAKQNQEVFRDITTNNVQPLEKVMVELDKFFKRNALNPKSYNVWCHTTFDFPLVQNYFKACGLFGMPYKGGRDIRTLVDLSGLNLNNYNWNRKTHNALDDCEFQVHYCSDAFKKLLTDNFFEK